MPLIIVQLDLLWRHAGVIFSRGEPSLVNEGNPQGDSMMKMHFSFSWNKQLDLARRHRTGLAVAALLLLASAPTYAQASPWENAVTVL